MTAPEGLTVLLGAGASHEAKLPMSFALTEGITEHVEQGMGGRSGTAEALHIAIGAMIAHDTANGKRAFAGIDVERLFSAVQMLGQRNEVELTPFVSSWNGALESVARSKGMSTFFGRNFRRALQSDFASDIDDVFKEGVEAVVGRAIEPVFRQLEGRMVAALREVLAVDPAKVDYLAPLLAGTEKPIQIATLNYDRTIEVLAERAGLTYDTGVESWSGGFDWTWSSEANVRLLKLHGSIDWWHERQKSTGDRLSQENITVDPNNNRDWNSRLAVIFGQRGKLRSDGPFLAMLRGLDEFLTRSSHLVVVGYSFRDDHINAAIRRWFNACDGPRVTVVNPALTDFPYQFGGRDAPPFQRELLEAMRMTSEEPPFVTSARPPHQVLPMPASAALKQLFGDGPRLAPVDAEQSAPGARA